MINDQTFNMGHPGSSFGCENNRENFSFKINNKYVPISVPDYNNVVAIGSHILVYFSKFILCT